MASLELRKIRSAPRRPGITLTETLLAAAIVGMTVAALGAMMHAAHVSGEYSDGYRSATQNARICIDRISRTVSEAYGNNDYCGAWVAAQAVGSYDFPDTLVVWHPAAGAPANPNGPPLANELVVYCPNPSAPNELWELTAPSDNQTIPAPGTAGFASFIENLKTSPASSKAVLTKLLRVASAGGAARRGCLRFVVTLNPTVAEWTDYQEHPSTSAFLNLPWPQGVFSSQAGMRQVWVRSELQMNPGSEWILTGSAAAEAVPFFGSAVFYYRMTP